MRNHVRRVAAGLGWLVILSGCGKAESNEAFVPKTKLDVATAHENGQNVGDECASQGWYGDSVCDTFCTDADPDCSPEPSTPVVCARFTQPANGVCARPAADPCRMQDPDCRDPQAPPPPPVDSENLDLTCALLVLDPDNVCSRPETDACRQQDPDCVPAQAPCLATFAGTCYETTAAACAAAGCTLDACSIAGEVPAQVSCAPPEPEPNPSEPCVAKFDNQCYPSTAAACAAAGCGPDDCIVRDEPVEVICPGAQN
jgi:hypothetical protein